MFNQEQTSIKCKFPPPSSKQLANGHFPDQEGQKGHNISLGLLSDDTEQSPRDIILHVFFPAYASSVFTVIYVQPTSSKVTEKDRS